MACRAAFRLSAFGMTTVAANAFAQDLAQLRKTDWPVIVANMMEQGTPVTADETRAISEYLAANFSN